MKVLEKGACVGGGRYRLERLLGKGGMGVVWQAEELATARPVALKLITGAEDTSTDFRRRLQREARAAMAVDHPNVVRIHEVIEDVDGEVILVMELLVGRSLGERLDHGGALSVRETLQIMGPVFSAVSAAHAAGVVHRDLKPDNIFIVGQGDGASEVRVLDFGVAKVTAVGRELETGLTVTGAMLGTPTYMSPEQACGEKDIDARADVWALGVIMFECLTGELPVRGENIGQIIKAIVTGRIARLDPASGLPRELIDIVHRCLAFERAARPTDLRGVASELATILMRLPESDAVPASGGPGAVGGSARRIALAVTEAGGPKSKKPRREAERAAESLKTEVPVHEPIADAAAPAATQSARVSRPDDVNRSRLAWQAAGAVTGLAVVLGVAWTLLPRARDGIASQEASAPALSSVLATPSASPSEAPDASLTHVRYVIADAAPPPASATAPLAAPPSPKPGPPRTPARLLGSSVVAAVPDAGVTPTRLQGGVAGQAPF